MEITGTIARETTATTTGSTRRTHLCQTKTTLAAGGDRPVSSSGKRQPLHQISQLVRGSVCSSCLRIPLLPAQFVIIGRGTHPVYGKVSLRAQGKVVCS